MRPRILILILSLSLATITLAPGVAVGQQIRIPGPRATAVSIIRPEITAPRKARVVNDSLVIMRRAGTHWKRGALIGGIIGAGAWIAVNLSQGCGGVREDSGCIAWSFGLSPVFGLLGAIPGSLIGGLFPKD